MNDLNNDELISLLHTNAQTLADATNDQALRGQKIPSPDILVNHVNRMLGIAQILLARATPPVVTKPNSDAGPEKSDNRRGRKAANARKATPEQPAAETAAA